jgi:hypothetical protein
LVLGMTASRLARRLGLDGNPLRRRTDKIAACLALVLVALFLIGAPVMSMAAVGWVSRDAAAGQQATSSWRQVPAVVQKPAPSTATSELFGYSLVVVKWTAPDGKARAGEIPVSAAVTVGQTVRLWVNAAGTPTDPPPSHGLVVLDESETAALAVIALGAVLLGLACAGRWVLDRRRLAHWEAGWAAVGPQWTRRFRSRG